MGDVQVLGVISREWTEPRLAYLDEPVAATPEILELAAPVAVSEVFRLSARCEEKKCTHFDGARCQLAVRIAKMLPEVVENLPACNIRRECRWFRQEGRAACQRCPQIVTGNPTRGSSRSRHAGRRISTRSRAFQRQAGAVAGRAGLAARLYFFFACRALQSADRRRRNAFGFSANSRPASRAAAFRCAERRASISGVSRERQGASG